MYLGRQAYADSVDIEQTYKSLHVLSFLKHITEIYRYDLSKWLDPLEKITLVLMPKDIGLLWCPSVVCISCGPQ